MPSNDGESFGSLEDLLQFLFAIETTVEGEVNKVADSIDAVTDRISAYLRSTIGLASATSEGAKPRPRPPATIRPVGYFEASTNWISRHRAITAAVVCFLGTGAFLIWRQRRLDRVKRRAKRGKNGQRTEIVILAGPPSAPLTRSISLDLQRRGFIVYIPVNSLWEERLIQAESKPNIHPLHLDVTSPSSLSSTIRKVTALFDPSNAPKYPLRLASLILLPQTPSPSESRRIVDISADTWSDALSIHLLAPFTLVQAFLPLVLSQRSSILFLTHSNTPSLSPPLHGEANVVAHALDSYISTLYKEIARSEGINISRFKLGALDDESDRDALQMAVALRHDNSSQSDISSSPVPGHRKVRGSPLRELHLELFDAIVGKRRGTVYVGRGSRTYDVLGKVMPHGLAGWILGLRAQNEEVRKDTKSNGVKNDSQVSPEWERVNHVSGKESA
ncbi:MAG: hypothetical protein L6R40_001307 [Gallowayella cf. fulva]|nr:MAG: hypothetical protein L6R40_001307 [Xanthomendoza cf. fulva]